MKVFIYAIYLRLRFYKWWLGRLIATFKWSLAQLKWSLKRFNQQLSTHTRAKFFSELQSKRLIEEASKVIAEGYPPKTGKINYADTFVGIIPEDWQTIMKVTQEDVDFYAKKDEIPSKQNGDIA